MSTETASRKAKYKVVTGQDARRSGKKAPRARAGKRIVLHQFPHSHAGRPKIADDMVGTPI